MSKIALSGNASGTGTLTIAAPNTNTDRTLTLPDSTGTILNDQSNIETQVKTATNATGSAPVYACRAWVNFNGTGTPAIRGSGNVSSITDNGTGNYIVNFTTAMPDTNYAPIASGYDDGSTPSITKTTQPSTTSQATLICSNTSNTLVDVAINTFCVFR
jgi:hypothetical protein